MNSSRRPRVTVAIPTRNRAQLLQQCIGSVLAQTMTDLEVIVSDNASTDDTARVVASFSDPRIRYAPLHENIGLYGNLSRCLRLGTAPYVALLPDDDLMLPRNLERKLRMLDGHPGVGIVHSAVRLAHIGQDGGVTETIVKHGLSDVEVIEDGPHVARRLLLEPYWIHITAAVVRRSIIADDGFDERDGGPADLGLCLRLAARAIEIAYLPEPLVVARMHPEAASVKHDGIHVLEAGTYRPTLSAIALSRDVKIRFLDDLDGVFPDQRELRGKVRRSHREALEFYLKSRAGGVDRSPRATWTLFREGARVDRGVWLSPPSLRFLIGGLLGRRGRTLGHRLLGRATASADR